MLVGLPHVNVLAVDSDAGRIMVVIETRREQPACLGCGKPGWVKDRDNVLLVEFAGLRAAALKQPPPQANAKVTEGVQHPDRNAQFEYINTTPGEHLLAGQPVMSVDCKKNELVGDCANAGKEWDHAPTRVGA